MRTNESKNAKEILKIGRHKYAALKNIEGDTLTDEQREQISAYEEVKGINKVYKRPEKKIVEWVEGRKPTKAVLYHLFISKYKELYGVDYDKGAESIQALAPVINYFAREEDFFKSSNLITNFMGKPIYPSFKKGLLLIGSPGNGKTSIMYTMHKVIYEVALFARENFWKTWREWEEIRFLWKTSVEMVMIYEGLDKGIDKTDFFKSFSNYRYCFDDLGRENKASNFGTREIFTDILFNRYNCDKAVTHLTMNYPDSKGMQSVESAMYSVGARYGAHIFDRFMEMFNIIEFKGSSFRK